MSQKIDTGRKGEEAALSYLTRQGYKIIERNYRTRFGEVDIIARDKGFISFIEVRSKNTDAFGRPEETIDRKKQLQITKAALSYIKRFHLESELCRFDVVCIEGLNTRFPKMRLIKNAFELDQMYSY